MAEKKDERFKVSITSKGVISVDPEELFSSPKVRKFIEDMASMDKSSQTPRKQSETANSPD